MGYSIRRERVNVIRDGEGNLKKKKKKEILRKVDENGTSSDSSILHGKEKVEIRLSSFADHVWVRACVWSCV